jgi:integrase
MPLIKTNRKDILRKKEIQETLTSMKPDVKAATVLLWLFGKRISEVLAIEREHIFVANGFLNVRFHVLKKRKEEDLYLKRITLKHPATKYLIEYLESTPSTGKIFPKLTRQLYLYYLKKANANAYAHLFRKSLATEFSERGFTVQQLMAWFDWSNTNIAMSYVNRGAGLTKELSLREW